MIDVTVDLDRFGLGTSITRLARITIANDGTGTFNRGNYIYRIYGKKNRVLRTGHILNWPRNSKTVLALLQAAINDAYPPKEHHEPKKPTT
jgi:hypothetical protein